MTHTLRRRFAVAASVTAALVLSAPPSTVDAAHPAGATHAGGGSAGDDGAGDPYFPKYGNGGYDVSQYFVSVRYDTATGRLNGKTKLTMRATKSLSSFNLDLVLRTSKVVIDGERVAFRAGAHELRITPDQPLARGDTVTVAVTYAGTPSDVSYNGVSPWTTTPDGAVALGEPEIAPWWFPSNDHPTDKAEYRLHVKVPDGKEAISGGTFKGRSHEPGWTTWKWHVGSKAATYLVFAAMGDYDIEMGISPAGRKYLYAFGNFVSPLARDSIRYTDEATSFLAERFGPYPFGRIGGVVPNGFAIGFALETQTRPVYDQAFFFSAENRGVVIHEMAHQWFGDSVAVQSWKNIWLNEGFATYAEWLWRPSGEGAARPRQRLREMYDQTPADDSFWDLKIGDPGPDQIFDGRVYHRGAMTAQALRNRVGTADFFEILHTWLDDRADRTGTTKQFKQLAEQISGEQLDGFFNAWLFTAAKPARTPANGVD